MNLFLVSVLAINLALAVWHFFQIHRQHRLIRKWQVLDTLLAQMAAQSFYNHHLPIWAAWTAVMGEINVQITQNRHMPEPD